MQKLFLCNTVISRNRGSLFFQCRSAQKSLAPNEKSVIEVVPICWSDLPLNQGGTVSHG